MKTSIVVMLVIVVGFILSGCSTVGPEKNLFGGGRVTTASANQIFDPGFEGFTDEQLFWLLDPDNTSSLTKRYNKLSDSEKIEYLRKAFRAANSKKYGLAHRSQIQDRLIAASDQRCNLYTTYLKRMSTYTNGIFGTLTTALGGAGAIVTGESSSRVLSGLAGISSGTRSELNESIFESITTSVIIPGIINTRRDLLAKMLEKRSGDSRKSPLSLEEYTVEGAIADAIRYHGACSMDSGISYAQKGIQSYDDIGIDKFNAMLKKIKGTSD